MGRIRDNSNYVELSIDQSEQLKVLRQMANVSLSEICRLMDCSTSKVVGIERGKGKVDKDFLDRLLKRYNLILKYKDK